jgi:hypothetical protein
MKTLNTSSSTFEHFITGNLLYVDKTAHIHRLVSPSKEQYFLARPRRFGKSLLVSTLKAIFEGKRELFKGLAIDQLEFEWKAHPVIHLNMGSCTGQDRKETELRLCDQLEQNAKTHGMVLKKEGASRQFEELILSLAEKNSIVVLVDEYDKPLLAHLGKEGAKDIQSLLKDFYSVIKTTESVQRFALITGISKFSKVSIFSDLNNLTDLTMHRDAGTLLGYTQDELEGNFGEYIELLGESLELDRETTLEKLREWYNGYRFDEGARTVYNPVSVMKCLAERRLKNYWFETATPTFLVDLLKKQPVIPEDLNLPETSFSAYEPDHLQVLPLLVQTGYLTLKSCENIGDERFFQLGYPNREVESSFSKILVKGMAELSDPEMGTALRKIYKALEQGEVDALMTQIKVFFKGIPHNIQLDNEKYYQSLFVALFRVIGAFVQAECCTADGRVDAILRSPRQILVLEFKLHDSAQAAMAQIHAKDYGLAWSNEGPEVVLVGVGFDLKTRNIGEWIIEKPKL